MTPLFVHVKTAPMDEAAKSLASIAERTAVCEIVVSYDSRPLRRAETLTAMSLDAVVAVSA